MVVRPCENVRGFHSYYHPLTVIASGVGAAPVMQPLWFKHYQQSFENLSHVFFQTSSQNQGTLVGKSLRVQMGGL